jgi:hypothetical protein
VAVAAVVIAAAVVAAAAAAAARALIRSQEVPGVDRRSGALFFGFLGKKTNPDGDCSKNKPAFRSPKNSEPQAY